MAWIELSRRQQGIVGAALTLLACIFLACAILGLLMLLGGLLNFFADVLLPLVAAAVLATMLKPFYEAVLARVRKPSLAVILVLLSVILPLVALFTVFGSLIIGQLVGFLHNLPVWLNDSQEALRKYSPQLSELWAKYGMGDRLKSLLQQQGGEIAKGIAGVGGSVLAAGASFFRGITGLLGWVVLPVYFVFLIQARPISGRNIESFLPFLKPETRADVVYLAGEFGSIMLAFFRGQLLIALCDGALYAIGFKLIGLPYGVIIGLLMGFLNVIPYLGGLVGLLIALPTAFFQADGGLTQLALTTAAIVVVQTLDGYVVTPRIMGDRTGLHPMAIIFAMFFWGTALGGILGMILAIPLTAFLVVFWRLLKAKYIKELV